MKERSPVKLAGQAMDIQLLSLKFLNPYSEVQKLLKVADIVLCIGS